MNKILIIIAILILTISGITAQEKDNGPKGQVLDKVIAVVGNKMVLLSDIEEVKIPLL